MYGLHARIMLEYSFLHTIRPGFMAQYGAVKRGTIRDCYFRDSEFVAYNEYIGTLRQEDRFRFGA